MDDVLIFGDSERSPELRREVPVGVVDPFLYAEASGTRHVVISRMEIPRLAAAGAGAGSGAGAPAVVAGAAPFFLGAAGAVFDGGCDIFLALASVTPSCQRT